MAKTTIERDVNGNLILPELEKMKSVSIMSQGIGQFLDWLEEQGIQLCKYQEAQKEWNETGTEYSYLPEGHYTINEGPEKLLYRYFEIDPIKVDDERRAILDDLRSKQK